MGCEIFEPVFGRFRSRGASQGWRCYIYHLPVGCLDCFPVVYCMAENVFGWEESY